ncbi:hypothetical protein B0F90DRAFT_1404669 [Multifurca ochricompacta]|uniref:Uncharacterized protein n=1 Tax=Multifurca ochricompacta TaxID=376703 RepID=A0AAD4QIU1_9AGAM|nr:hypothetical protein B0F90DRAFT_1404669 [Multifurca ochricompacta]
MHGVSFKFYLISYIRLSALRAGCLSIPYVLHLSVHSLQSVSYLLTRFAIYGFLLLYRSFQIWTLNKYIKVSRYTACCRASNQQSGFSLSFSLLCAKKLLNKVQSQSAPTAPSSVTFSTNQRSPTSLRRAGSPLPPLCSLLTLLFMEHPLLRTHRGLAPHRILSFISFLCSILFYLFYVITRLRPQRSRLSAVPSYSITFELVPATMTSSL